MLLTALGSVSLLNQLSTRLGHEAPVGCGAPASTRPSSTRSGNAKSFSGHTPPAAPVAGQPQPGAVHRAAQRLLRPAGPRVRRRWPCRLTLRQPPWADPYARCCGRGGATRLPLSRFALRPWRVTPRPSLGSECSCGPCGPAWTEASQATDVFTPDARGACGAWAWACAPLGRSRGRERGGFLFREASNRGRPYPHEFEETQHEGSTIRRTELVAAHD